MSWKAALIQSRQYLEFLKVLGLHLSNGKTKQNISGKAWFQLLDSSTGASLRKFLSRHLREHNKKSLLLLNHFSLRTTFSKSSVIFHIKLQKSAERSIIQVFYFKANSKKPNEIEIHKNVTNWDSKLRKILHRHFRF